MKQYLAVTDHGHWGRGATLLDALQNAEVNQAARQVNIYHAPDGLILDICIDEFGFVKYKSPILDPAKVSQLVWVGFWSVSVSSKGKITLKELAL